MSTVAPKVVHFIAFFPWLLEVIDFVSETVSNSNSFSCLWCPVVQVPWSCSYKDLNGRTLFWKETICVKSEVHKRNFRSTCVNIKKKSVVSCLCQVSDAHLFINYS
jgi:hypothetical protein